MCHNKTAVKNIYIQSGNGDDISLDLNTAGVKKEALKPCLHLQKEGWNIYRGYVKASWGT